MNFCRIAAAAAFVVPFLVPARAEAKPKLAADVEAGIPVNADGISASLGGNIRFGYEIRIPLISITPEVGLGYQTFGGTPSAGAFRAFAGGRLGIGEIVRPGIFAHVGYGHIGYSGGPADVGFSSAALDGGVFVDFTLLPIFDIGVHGSYNTLTASDGNPAANWIAAGVHASFVF